MAFRGSALVFALLAASGAADDATQTSHQTNAPAGVCLLQKTPGHIQKPIQAHKHIHAAVPEMSVEHHESASCLPTWTTCKTFQTANKRVHSLLQRHHAIVDRLHHGHRVGEVTKKAHNSVGSAISRLRQSHESLMAAVNHEALHAALLQLDAHANELKQGLDLLEGTASEANHAAQALSNVHALLDRHKTLSDRVHQGGRHFGKAAKEIHAAVGQALTRLRQNAESVMAAETAGAVHTALLQLKTPANDLKSGLDRLEGTVNAAEVLSNVYSLLQRHKALSDGQRHGDRQVGQATREAHNTVGKALTQLRKSTESVWMNVATAADSRAALHGAILQMNAPASDLEEGLDRLEAAAEFSDKATERRSPPDGNNMAASQKESTEKKDSDEVDENSKAQLDTASQDHETASRKHGDKNMKSKTQLADEHKRQRAFDSQNDDHRADTEVDAHTKKKIASTSREEKKQKAGATKHSKPATVSQQAERKEGSDDDVDAKDDAEADDTSTKAIAYVSQKADGDQDAVVADDQDDVATDDKNEDAVDDTSDDAVDAETTERREDDDEGNDESSQENVAASQDAQSRKGQDESQENADEEDVDETENSDGEESAPPAATKNKRKMAALERHEEDSRGGEARGSGEDSELLEIRRRPDSSAPMVGTLRAGEHFRVHRQRRTSDGEVWLELADRKGFVSQAQAARVNVGRMEALGLLDAGERVREESDGPEVSQEPMANGFPKKVAPKHDVDHDAMHMKLTKMSVKSLPEESSYENGKTETADWRNEYKWSTEAPSEIERNNAARTLPLASLAAVLSWVCLN